MDHELLCRPPDGYHAGCYDCEAQYLPVDIQKSGESMYSGQFTDEEAKKHIKTLLDIIKAARTTLSQTLKTHGDLILNRWSKKSKEKRAALLSSTTLLGVAAAGNDGPDPLDRWIRSNGMTWNGARWMALKPFAEDRMRLLSLLYLRTTYPPSAWGLVNTRESMASFGHPDPTSRFKACEAGGSIRHTELMRMDSMKSEDRLAYLIYRLQEGVSNGSIHLSVNFDMLERELLSQGPASLIDKRMLDQLSDITTLDELRQMWLWNQMGQGTFDVELAKKTPAEFHEHVVGGSLQRAARFEPRTIARIARLLRAFAETPWPKCKGRKDLAWLYAATESRNKLAAFWDALREELRQAQVAAGLNMERSALGTFDFDSEPEHLAYLEHERAECEETSRLAEANALAALQRLSVAPDDDAIWSASSESGPIRRKQTKAKASRARGSCEDESANEVTASSATDTTSSSEDEACSTTAPIFVKQDSISTFHKMFRSDSAEGGGVRWSQFVQAFEDAGFTPTTGGGGGSSVSFSSDVGTIVFHRPHPDPVIDPVMLHGMGRRMRRRFGWCRERFLVRPKGD
ncbi:hypothetical protein LTR27_004902 [Elasticomyces elasticus]|nr:hypothetical protein LTR27_004902 [Elasticomyces elasticus]